jgi:ribonuclease HI
VKGTNNRAELLAIEYVIDHLSDEYAHVLIHTDSGYSISAIVDGIYHANADIIDRVRNKINTRRRQGHHIFIAKVRGHNGTYGNNIADALAGKHTKKQ